MGTVIININTAGIFTCKPVLATDFTGNDYQDNDLIGKSYLINFKIFLNSGSGVMLKENDGFTFDSLTGTITMTPEDIVIDIY